MTERNAKKVVGVIEDSAEDFGELQDALQDEFTVRSIRDFDVFRLRSLLPELDIVLVDIYEDRTGLPKGLDIIREIANSNQSVRIPVIIMSSPSKAQLDDITEAMEDGKAYDFIWKTGPKAASRNELILKINAAIRRTSDEANSRQKRRRLLLTFQIILVLLTIATISSALFNLTAATLMFQAALLLVSILSLPWIHKYL
jgi:DNA-binding response OmpR family regulator